MEINNLTKKIIKKIKSKKTVISVIGLGYVGLPLSIALSNSKFKVFGIDNNIENIKTLKNGKSHIKTIKDNQIKNLKNFTPTFDFKDISKSDIIIICVPTPIDKKKQPNLKYVKNVVFQIEKYIKKYQTIILECTSYPGTTEEYFIPMFKRKQFSIGKNIFLGYSPEREDPGNEKFSILKKNLSKVVSGYTYNCKEIVKEVYKNVSNKVYACKDIKTAEFTKLLENIYRSVNIGLINELHLVCKKMKINIFDALNAAETKPFGFKAFYPGPGVGGHCIPVDPYFLTYKAKQFGVLTNFIKLAGKINDQRPLEISKTISNFIKKKKLKKKVLILGFTYKKNSDDIRESPIVKIYKLLRKRIKNDVYICDPLINKNAFKSINNFSFISYKDIKKKNFSKSFDLCFVGTNHDMFDYEMIAKKFKFIFDSRNSFMKKTKNIIIV